MISLDIQKKYSDVEKENQLIYEEERSCDNPLEGPSAQTFFSEVSSVPDIQRVIAKVLDKSRSDNGWDLLQLLLSTFKWTDLRSAVESAKPMTSREAYKVEAPFRQAVEHPCRLKEFPYSNDQFSQKLAGEEGKGKGKEEQKQFCVIS